MKRRSFVALLTAWLGRAQTPAQTLAQTPEQTPGQNPAQAPPAASGFTIAGVVVNAASNAPVSKALVQIALTTNRSESREVVTGADGRFSFANLPVNKYALTVTRTSGFPQGYLANGNYSTAIVTGPDQDTSQIVFRHHPPGTITGTVLDENGEPVRNAQVHLFGHHIDESGFRRLAPAGMAQTKSSGQFRLPHLRPGNFILGVSGQPWFAQRTGMRTFIGRPNMPQLPAPGRDPQFDVVYPFTYYPNAQDAAAASPIAVAEGAETGVQMALRAVPAIHVRLVGGDWKPGSGTNIQAALIGPEGHPIPSSAGAFANAGQGELSGIAPGRYQLSVNTFALRTKEFPNGDVQRESSAPGSFSRKVVDLVDGATVDLNAGSRISVRATVTVTGSDRPMNRISLVLRDQRTNTAVNATAAADGSMRFPEANFSPGRYELSLPGTPAFRLLAVEAKGAKITGNELIIEDNADIQLAVVIGKRSSVTVNGFAVRDDRAVVGAMVLLTPVTPALGATIYRDQSDSDGSFTFAGVSAGTYRAIAIDDGRDFAYGDPVALKNYLARAQPVTIGESAGPVPLKILVQQRLA